MGGQRGGGGEGRVEGKQAGEIGNRRPGERVGERRNSLVIRGARRFLPSNDPQRRDAALFKERNK